VGIAPARRLFQTMHLGRNAHAVRQSGIVGIALLSLIAWRGSGRAMPTLRSARTREQPIELRVA
jgi:hypothetical protein